MKTVLSFMVLALMIIASSFTSGNQKQLDQQQAKAKSHINATDGTTAMLHLK